MTLTLTFTNTLSKQKEQFVPPTNHPILMYVCGITPYDHAHIGHGRVYVTFDLLTRLLRTLEYHVVYVRNVTDIDDKLINKALAETNDIYAYKDIAAHFTKLFRGVMHRLNCLDPDHEPLVTECIQEIIDFVQGLIDTKHAYVVGHDVYFSIASFPHYGKLSGRDLDDLIAGARVDINEKKKHPGDFVLWKGNSENQFWKSPWGYGRPGWHIECSVMAKKHLGITINIHAGGMDLIFPHHENEIAQSEALHNQPFSHFWLHNAFININKEKMSKSLGNFVTLASIFETYDPMVLRYFYLQHHYRSPIDYAEQDLEAAQTAYKKLVSVFSPISTPTPYTLQQLLQAPILKNLFEALVDDLNTPKFLGIVFEHLHTIKTDPILASYVKAILQNVLGLTLTPLTEKTVECTPEIKALLNAREQARKEKNWALADSIRTQLLALGYQPQDKKM